ncbi:MAG: hypothetical protein DMG08_16745 [Acidobacteria bacterium]|nr:MAG: hypothetical protein DMG08_16745 [Acidobacteriota bacterium]
MQILSGGQGYFHREDAKSAKKSDFKNFAFFASSRWIFWIAAGLHCENTLSVAGEYGRGTTSVVPSRSVLRKGFSP